MGQSELGRAVAEVGKYERENYYILGHSHQCLRMCVLKEFRGS